MSQTVDITCDRCGVVIKGGVDNGSGPHWDLAFHSMSREVKRKGEKFYGFDAISWDVCDECATAVAKVLIEQGGLKPRDAMWQKPARERLGV